MVFTSDTAGGLCRHREYSEEAVGCTRLTEASLCWWTFDEEVSLAVCEASLSTDFVSSKVSLCFECDVRSSRSRWVYSMAK